MKFMNKFILIVGLAMLAATQLQAASKSETFTTNETRNAISTAATVSSVSISAGASAVTVKLYNSKTTGITYTFGAYTNLTSYTTNLVTSYVTTTGITINQTNRVLFVIKQATAGATNTLPAAAELSVSANTTTAFPVDLVFGRGVTANVNTNATVVFTYRSQKSNLQ